MPQIFQVLKCYKCLTFQVHQTKKSNKFACKMCGEKQSIKRHYGVGNGQECRAHVQKLNGIRGELDKSKSFEYCPSSDEDVLVSSPIKPAQKRHSKWTDFVAKDEVTEITNDDDDKMFLDDTEVVLEVPKKKRQKRSDINNRLYKGRPKSESREMVQGTNSDYQEINCNPCDVNNKLSSKYYSPIKYRKGEFRKGEQFCEKLMKLPKQFESDQLEIIQNNSTPENLSKELESKLCQIKFLPPVINPNSKWTKFTDEPDSSQHEVLEESLALNTIESQCNDELDTANMKYNDSNVMEGSQEIASNLTKFPPISSEIEECYQEYNNNLNNSKLSTIENKYYDSSPKTVNSAKKDFHNLFSLCDDNKIDDFLDI